MKRIFSIIIAVSIICVYSCSDSSEKEIIKVNYGYSFGECYGYCSFSATLDADQYTSKKFSFSGDENYSDIDCLDENTLDWAEIKNLADYEVVSQLDEIIGCPDCADGGAEYIELFTETESHKVTFEYNNPPEGLNSLRIRIRNKAEDPNQLGCE